MARDIASFAQGQCQLSIVPRAIRKLVVAGQRETRTFVFDDFMDDPIIAPINENVRDGLAQFQALRNRVEMILALGGRILDQIVVTELIGSHEHRSPPLRSPSSCPLTSRMSDDCGTTIF